MKPAPNKAEQGALLRIRAGAYAYADGFLGRAATPPVGTSAFYAPDFFLRDRTPWWLPRRCAVVSAITLRSEFQRVAKPKPTAFEPPSRAQFANAFRMAAEWRDRDAVAKAVPIAFAHSRVADSRAMRLHLLASLLRTPPRYSAYGLWHDDEGLLGATPELLVRWDGHLLHTMALAGTRPTEPLQTPWSKKNRGEHKFVVDDIRRRLTTLGKVVVSKTQTARFTAIEHLRTPIACRPKETPTLASTVELLHPTAALGVFPRQAGWERLSDLPGGSRRGRFGAPFGFQHADGRFWCVVAIRGVQWNADRWRLGCGVGVVAASEFEDEWQELAWKRNATLRTLQWPLTQGASS